MALTGIDITTKHLCTIHVCNHNTQILLTFIPLWSFVTKPKEWSFSCFINGRQRYLPIWCLG